MSRFTPWSSSSSSSPTPPLAELKEWEWARYDGFRVISNSETGNIEALVPLKRHPPSWRRFGWMVLLKMSLDALFRRGRSTRD